MDDARDKLDRLIDGALAGYADAEPLAGLEARVTNRVRMARADRRMFGWGVGLGVAASIVVVGILIETGRRPVPKTTELARATIASPTDSVLQRPRTVGSSRRRGTRSSVRPKLEQFPAPSPMTPEERALVAWVQRDPKAAQQIYADLQKQADGPIEIQSIEIAPLQNDGAQ